MHQCPTNDEQHHELAHWRETIPPISVASPTDEPRKPGRLKKATTATTATELGRASPIQLIYRPALHEQPTGPYGSGPHKKPELLGKGVRLLRKCRSNPKAEYWE